MTEEEIKSHESWEENSTEAQNILNLSKRITRNMPYSIYHCPFCYSKSYTIENVTEDSCDVICKNCGFTAKFNLH